MKVKDLIKLLNRLDTERSIRATPGIVNNRMHVDASIYFPMFEGETGLKDMLKEDK